MVSLPKRVSLLTDQLFRILWSLSNFSKKLTCTGVHVSSKVENILAVHIPYLWPIILVSRRGGWFLNFYRSQSIGLQFLRNWLLRPEIRPKLSRRYRDLENGDWDPSRMKVVSSVYCDILHSVPSLMSRSSLISACVQHKVVLLVVPAVFAIGFWLLAVNLWVRIPSQMGDSLSAFFHDLCSNFHKLMCKCTQCGLLRLNLISILCREFYGHDWLQT